MEQAAPAETSPVFRISRLNRILLIVTALVLLVFSIAKLGTARGLGVVAGQGVASLLMAFFCGWVVWQFRGKMANGGSLTFAIVLLLSTLANITSNHTVAEVGKIVSSSELGVGDTNRTTQSQSPSPEDFSSPTPRS